MKHLKLFEYFTKDDIEKAYRKRRKQKRYPIFSRTDFPQIKPIAKIPDSLIPIIRNEWDRMRKIFKQDDIYKNDIKMFLKQNKFPPETIDIPGGVIPNSLINLLFNSMQKKVKVNKEEKPKEIKERPSVGFKISSSNENVNVERMFVINRILDSGKLSNLDKKLMQKLTTDLTIGQLTEEEQERYYEVLRGEKESIDKRKKFWSIG
jgi:hypothetical protein